MFHHVFVKQAGDLQAVDSGGTSDPYVIVQAVMGSRIYVIGKTPVIKKNLYPVWDDEMKKPFKIPSFRAEKFVFIVMDNNVILKDEFLSSCTFVPGVNPTDTDIDFPLTKGYLRVHVKLNVERFRINEMKKPEGCIYAITNFPMNFYGVSEKKGLTTYDDWDLVTTNAYRLRSDAESDNIYHPLLSIPKGESNETPQCLIIVDGGKETADGGVFTAEDEPVVILHREIPVNDVNTPSLFTAGFNFQFTDSQVKVQTENRILQSDFEDDERFIATVANNKFFHLRKFFKPGQLAKLPIKSFSVVTKFICRIDLIGITENFKYAFPNFMSTVNPKSMRPLAGLRMLRWGGNLSIILNSSKWSQSVKYFVMVIHNRHTIMTPEMRVHIVSKDSASGEAHEYFCSPDPPKGNGDAFIVGVFVKAQPLHFYPVWQYFEEFPFVMPAVIKEARKYVKHNADKMIDTSGGQINFVN
ncbi:C2 domain containing protein [Histomonas meleagridis]|uniref:C2 domain containing protein n=1 Tax=Histomonas meleagridis TaxID=135588 RepID=UPI00355A1188|nr:C2 domain containing protein [Histomonas meleagridis]KAH0804192.1 C2 domain containing protein [Histomonas meleagridis]